MARIETDPNYTAPTFPRGTEGVDLFKKEDVQKMAEAFSLHNHTPGKGALLTASSVPPGVLVTDMLADSAVTTAKLADNSVSTAKLQNGAVTSAKIGGALSLSGGLTAPGVTSTAHVAATSYVAAGPAISGAAGDVTANRSNNTGYIFLGNGSHYLGFDGTNYVMPSSNLYVNGGQVATEHNVIGMNGKTLNSPALAGTVSGQPAWASSQNFPAGTSIYGPTTAAYVTFDFALIGGAWSLPSMPGSAGRKIVIFIRAGGAAHVYSSTGAGSFWVGQNNYATTGYPLADGNGMIIAGHDGNWFGISLTENPTW